MSLQDDPDFKPPWYTRSIAALQGERVRLAEYGIGAAIGAGLGTDAVLAFQFGAAAASAFTGIVAAGAAITIPIVLARAARRETAASNERARKDLEAAEQRASALAEVTAMRELVQQWQTYNLAVASGSLDAAAVNDEAFRDLTPEELKELHLIFFKLTALHQLYFAMTRNSLTNDWAEQMLADIGSSAQENPKLYKIATSGRGYTGEFVAAITGARHAGSPEREPHRVAAASEEASTTGSTANGLGSAGDHDLPGATRSHNARG